MRRTARTDEGAAQQIAAPHKSMCSVRAVARTVCGEGVPDASRAIARKRKNPDAGDLYSAQLPKISAVAVCEGSAAYR